MFSMKKGRIFIFQQRYTSGIFSIFFFAFRNHEKDDSFEKHPIPFNQGI